MAAKYKWPIARELMGVLPRFHSELVPHIREVFSSTDNIWKSWVLCLIKEFPKETVLLLSDDIKRMCNNPTAGEHEESADEYACEVVQYFEL